MSEVVGDVIPKTGVEILDFDPTTEREETQKFLMRFLGRDTPSDIKVNFDTETL